MEQAQQHTITVENRKRFTATQIEAVISFSSTQIVLSYAGGRIFVTGSDMKITAFSKSGGGFSASGNFNSVRYGQKSAGLRQRLFK